MGFVFCDRVTSQMYRSVNDDYARVSGPRHADGVTRYLTQVFMQ